MGEPIPNEKWEEQKQKELDRAEASLEGFRKARGKAELVLMLVCCVAVLYTYPKTNPGQEPTVDIKALDLTIPLSAAIALFPTIICCCYLVFLTAAVRVAAAVGLVLKLGWQLTQYRREGKRPFDFDKESASLWRLPVIYQMTLPTLVPMLLVHGPGKIVYLYAIVSVAVAVILGCVFTAIPFASAIYITVRAHTLLKSNLLLAWDVVCLALMVLMLIMNLVIACQRKGRVRL